VKASHEILHHWAWVSAALQRNRHHRLVTEVTTSLRASMVRLGKTGA